MESSRTQTDRVNFNVLCLQIVILAKTIIIMTKRIQFDKTIIIIIIIIMTKRA